MHKEERRNKNGELISIRFFCSGKDPITEKSKLYSKTWKVRKGMSAAELRKEKLKAEIEFQEEVEKLSCGIKIVDENPLFEEFANEWHENILKRQEDAYNYYNSTGQHLNVIIPFFKGDRLKNIGPNQIQKFYDFLSSSTYEKQNVVVKNSIKELIKYKEQYKIADNIGINRLTLRMASNIGNTISIVTARKICKYFNVSLDKYFEVVSTRVRYSKATIMGVRTTLVMIFAEAKRRMLIEHNYATSEYTKPLKGQIKEKKILSEDEAKRFIKCILEEKDLRKKACLALFIFGACRKAEVAALSLDCIDFKKNIIYIKNNAIYAGKKFGIKLKTPKTKNSYRKIVMPPKLAEILWEYKIWLEQQQELHGDLWAGKNYLFMQSNGNIINPSTLAQWVTKFEIENGFEHIPCHSLRHTACCLMLKSGIPVKVVSDILGHHAPGFTLQVYTHIMEGQKEDASIIYNNFLCCEN